MKRKRKYNKVNNLPDYCDFSCQHADFASVDSIGACRREQAVYCKLVKKLNTKNAKCFLKKSF